MMTGNKDNDKPLMAMIDKEYRDEKAVKNAITRINSGDYVIIETAEEEASEEETEPVEQ